MEKTQAPPAKPTMRDRVDAIKRDLKVMIALLNDDDDYQAAHACLTALIAVDAIDPSGCMDEWEWPVPADARFPDVGHGG